MASDRFAFASVNLGFRSKELDRDQGDQVISVHKGNAVHWWYEGIIQNLGEVLY